MPRPSQAKGRREPVRDKVYSVETQYGPHALVRAKSPEAIAETLLLAKEAGGFAVLERLDGEPILIEPTAVWLIAEPMPL
jgi:hypothetical protein